jgi:LuxR family maltose regulon positive regulatory protein
MAGLRRWLDRVEPTDRGPYPLAFCAEAWLRVVTERVPDLDPLLRRIDEALADVPADYPAERRRRATLHTRVLAAYAARYRHRLREALEIGREAEELLEGDDALTRGFLVYNTGRVRMALGEMEPAAELLDRAFPDHLRAGNRYLTLATLGRQGAIRAQTHGVVPALETLAAALVFARERGLDENPALSIVHFHRGWVHLLAHDLEEADAAFVEALERASARDFPEERGNALVGRARVAMARGELGRARDLLIQVSALEQVGNVDLFETALPLEWLRLALRREELGATASVGPVPEPVPGAPDEGWNVRRETALILGLRQGLLRTDPEGLREEAARLVAESSPRKRGPALLSGCLVQALDPGNPDRWATLDRALRLGAGRGYVGPVLELGDPVAVLLRAASGRPDLSPGARAWADALLDRAAGEPTRDGTGDPPACTLEVLTPREEEVLAQLFTGKTNKAIARSLFVSVDTVKTHLKHVYAKLGVSGRSQAILRAREMGWDPPVGGRP